MTFYVNERESNRRPSRELFYVAVVVLVVAAMLWSCAPPPSPAQPGDPIPDPGEGQVWRFQLPGPLPDWVVVMQEALALRRTTLDEFVSAGKAQAQAVIDAPGTDAEVAAAKLLLRGYEIIGTELRDVALRSDIRSEEVGRLILERIEVGAFGIFEDAEREALAQAAFDYSRSVIAAEAATQAAIWNAMATTAIDLPSDLGSPVDAPGE